MDETVKEYTRADWRALGFFYDRNDVAREWLLVGSRVGLGRFADILRVYAANPRNGTKSEHEHYGPYMYLEVMTWPEPGIDGHSVHGPLPDLARLAGIVDAKIAFLQPSARATIGEEYAPSCKYTLVLELRDDDFDPPDLDSNLNGSAG